jgi:hypothetical protein
MKWATPQAMKDSLSDDARDSRAAGSRAIPPQALVRLGSGRAAAIPRDSVLDHQRQFGNKLTARLMGAAASNVVPRLASPRVANAPLAKIRSRAEHVDGNETRYLARSFGVAAPPGGVATIKAKATAVNPAQGDAMGLTINSGSAPLLYGDDALYEPTTKTWKARVRSVELGAANYESLYPGVGTHKITDAIYAYVTPEASSLSYMGESEHIQDIDLAYALTVRHVAFMINMMAAFGKPVEGPTEQDALSSLRKQLRDTLDTRLRWPLSLANSPGSWPAHWQSVFTQLSDVTVDRDRNHWHDIGWDLINDPAEKAKEGVPSSARFERYTGPGANTNIGVVDPYSHVMTRYASLPTY